MHRFRQRDGDLFADPPFGVSMDDVFILVLEADRAKLQSVCDNDLNVGPERFSPLGDFLVLYGATIDNLSMGTTTRASEIGFWIPVMTERDGRTELFTYTPYVWLGSSTSTRVGRTLYGYPKQVADVTVPSSGDPLRLELKGEVLVPTSKPDAFEMREETILSAGPTVPGSWKRPPTEGIAKWLELAELMARTAIELVALPDIEAGELTQLVGGMRSIFLHQLPGVAAFDPPAYQALIEAPIVPRVGTVSGKLLEEQSWRVSIPSYRQPLIAETLGLRGERSADGRTFETTPRAVAWMEFEGTLERGVEIWRAGG